ncbi:uncharacterized protein Z519_05686 [Cladophialophora bantiana CBS 173.52]|uniref:Uncharacterized protein n=1 Tax=Cladophialophora bantiana (strain ATCC 10958 / CBS 173.52 / CDC B-1940 / NIH 8579) TaxID=1442370 RepID=A0A0D2ET66_CLAB1|nr:uncharacterized protein Z519_05686 [Cladophialophora bantiana CBS 173.52]KIW93081.1 hypothetical protein Z519_05686 [Cladophialophora bantiana CBS 173.52]
MALKSTLQSILNDDAGSVQPMAKGAISETHTPFNGGAGSSSSGDGQTAVMLPNEKPSNHASGAGQLTSPSPTMSISFIVSPEEPKEEFDDKGAPAGRPCHHYTEEHGFFVWYHRVDLGEDWRVVGKEFWEKFGKGRALVALQGLYYGFSKRKGVKSRRIRPDSRVPRMVEWTHKRYSWMRPEDRKRPQRH